MTIRNWIRRLRWRCSISWRFFAAIAVPIILLPFNFATETHIVDEETGRLSTKSRMLYVIILMSVYWALEIIPLPVTSLIPLVLFPLLGVQSAYTVSQNYTKESNMIFLGGVIVGLGVEYCGLHHRIALRVMTLVGASPVGLLFGIMAITAILSMWISSTTCVAMIVPVVIAIIDEIHGSPEVMTKQEVRRRSSTGLFDDSGLDAPRRRSAASISTISEDKFGVQRARQMSSVFGNAALSRTPSPNHLAPSSHSQPRLSVGSKGVGLSPIMELPKNDSNSLEVSVSVYPDISIVIAESDTESLQNHDESKSHENKHVGFANVADDESLRSSHLGSTLMVDRNGLEDEIKARELDEKNRRSDIKKMFLFGMAYAANIGGTAVITGTSPNKIFKEVIKQVEYDQDDDYLKMTFFVWMALNVPAMLVNILVAWISLAVKYYGSASWRKWFCKCFPGVNKNSSEEDDEEDIYKWRSQGVKLFLRKEYLKLGRISFHEVAVGIIFVGVVVLWSLRSPELFSGWGEVIPGSQSGDSTPAMLAVILLFICPKDFKFLYADESEDLKYEPLLDWKFVATKFPWGVLLLLGSGFALADASEYSGLSEWIGDELLLLKDLPNELLLLIVIIITSILTEVVSNVACANILLPIIVSVSKGLELHPLYLTVACTLTCSYAFLFPIATPSNVIVFAAGNFTTKEMVKTGLFLNLICIAVLYVNTIYYGDIIFNYSDYDYKSSSNESF